MAIDSGQWGFVLKHWAPETSAAKAAPAPAMAPPVLQAANRLAAVRQVLGSRLAAVRQVPGSRLAAVRQVPGSHLAAAAVFEHTER